jgi:hypothetical protein
MLTSKVATYRPVKQSAEYLKPGAVLLLKKSYAATVSAMLISDSSVTDLVLSLFEARANGGETGWPGGRRDQEHPGLGFLKG